MPQLPNSRPPRPPRDRLTKRKQLLQALEERYAQTSLQLLKYILSDDEDSDSDGNSDQDTHDDPSSPLSFAMSISPPSSLRAISPISERSSLHIRDSSVAPSSDVDEMELLTLVHERFKALHDHILNTRYLHNRTPIPHNPQINLLLWYKENSPIRFQRKVRMAPATFDHILSLITTDEIFMSTSPRGQIAVDIQLAIFLNRLGHYGNASSVEDIADWAGVSSGSVINCTKRCMTAIIKHHDLAMSEPSDREKHLSKEWSERKTIPEWRNGWLAVDGTTFPLFQKPGLHGEAWFDKSSQYSMNGQFVMLLHNLRFIDYSLGHTGSAHDSYAFQSTRISSNHQTLIPAGDWMWADSAYPI